MKISEVNRGVVCPGYTEANFYPDRFQALVNKTVAKIKDIQVKHPEVEALAATGHSGLMLMGAVSYITGLPQIAVRKRMDTDHDSRMVNGWLGAKEYVILDDLISSGRTVERIITEIDKATEYFNENLYNPTPDKILPGPKPVAVLLYEDGSTNEYRPLFGAREWDATKKQYKFSPRAGVKGKKFQVLPVYSVDAKDLEIPDKYEVEPSPE